MVLTSHTLKYLLDYLTGQNTSAPAYLALSTTAPTETGENVTEPSGGGYARLLLGNGSSNRHFSPASYDAETGYASTANIDELHFNAATASWGTIVGWAIYQNQTGGQPKAYGTFATSITVAVDNIATIRVGKFSITVDADTLEITANVGQ